MRSIPAVVRRALCVLASVLPFSVARAGAVGPRTDLILFEDLSAAVRPNARTQVTKFLADHPGIDPRLVYFAFDRSGLLYVIDRDSARVQLIGQPSCIGNGPT